jgi:hypothetical protein
VFCTSQTIAADASTLESSSTASVTIMSEPPAPPYRSSTSIPMSPRSKYLGTSSGSNFPARSIVFTRGATSSAANAATASRNMISSSVSVVSGGRASVALVIAGAAMVSGKQPGDAGRHAEV